MDDGFRQAAKAQAHRSCKECSACRKLQDVTARAHPRTSEASKTTGLPYTQTVQRKAATFEKLPMDLYPSKVAEGADSLLRAGVPSFVFPVHMLSVDAQMTANAACQHD